MKLKYRFGWETVEAMIKRNYANPDPPAPDPEPEPEPDGNVGYSRLFLGRIPRPEFRPGDGVGEGEMPEGEVAKGELRGEDGVPAVPGDPLLGNGELRGGPLLDEEGAWWDLARSWAVLIIVWMNFWGRFCCFAVILAESALCSR
jgi:hypothetical protein